ncbi:MAG TPA: acyltransferase [Bacteroidia bacterium]|nr:acyltransferase [Bacteroidia bacterium]
MENNKVYFPGLNGLRFFAAFAVVVTHIELVKHFQGYPTLWVEHTSSELTFKNILQKIVFQAGGLGVYFFFVLSGFLITFLLLTEKAQTGTVAVKKFYWRRILRIWPLYYFIVILGFFVIPYITTGGFNFTNKELNANYGTNLLLYLIIFPNIAHAIYNPVPLISQTWSIGVEEQFYLIWPVLAKKAKNIFKMLVVVFLVMVGIKVLILILFKLGYGNRTLEIFKKFMAMSKIECMTIGGMGAYLLFNYKEKFKSIVYHPLVLPMSLIAIPILILFTPNSIQDGIHLVYSVIFLFIIANISGNPNSFLKLENKTYNFLGKISYSIYMYHFMLIPAMFYLFKKIGIFPSNEFVPQLLMYVSITGISILVSWLSFNYFEGWFLKLKSKYTIIKSGS